MENGSKMGGKYTSGETSQEAIAKVPPGDNKQFRLWQGWNQDEVRETLALGTKFKQAFKDAVIKVNNILIEHFLKININAKQIHDEQNIKM